MLLLLSCTLFGCNQLIVHPQRISFTQSHVALPQHVSLVDALKAVSSGGTVCYQASSIPYQDCSGEMGAVVNKSVTIGVNPPTQEATIDCMFQSRFLSALPGTDSPSNFDMKIELRNLQLRNGFAGVGGLIQAQVIIRNLLAVYAYKHICCAFVVHTPHTLAEYLPCI